MTRRIAHCDRASRHRWAWRPFSFTDDDLIVWDRKCIRCGRWRMDV